MTNNFSSKFFQLPLSIQELIQLAVNRLNPSKIVLFGSRARGDHRNNSDYDIAFYGISDEGLWNRFILAQEELPISLLKYDLVQFENLSSDYHQNISKEGIELFNKS